MQRSKKLLFFISSTIACFMMALASGCASGGFKLTREYAGWVNRQNIILRIVLYILTFVVFTVTLLIDAVVFNTIDFWEGKVSAGSFEFKDGSKVYQVKHEFLPNSKLRKSTIQISDNSKNINQEVLLVETPSGNIEMFVDGKLRTRVNGISEFPIASVFNEQGALINENAILLSPVIAVSK